VTTYREIESAWWRWALERVPRRMPARDVVRKVGSEPFSYNGTTWTIRLHPIMGGTSATFRNEYHFVGADGRLLRPPKRPANRRK
jgi:hypothetical protein